MRKAAAFFCAASARARAPLPRRAATCKRRRPDCVRTQAVLNKMGAAQWNGAVSIFYTYTLGTALLLLVYELADDGVLGRQLGLPAAMHIAAGTVVVRGRGGGGVRSRPGRALYAGVSRRHNTHKTHTRKRKQGGPPPLTRRAS